MASSRYYVFAYGDCNYPAGGMGDCVGRFDHIDEAEDCAEAYKNYDLVEVVDMDGWRGFWEVD